MKIVYVITALTLGGAETQLKSLISKMDLNENEVTIITLTGRAVVTFSEFDVDIIELEMSKSILSFLVTLKSFYFILKRIEPDVVHSHMYHANIFCRLARIFTKIKLLICSAHSTTEGGRISEILYRHSDFLCDLTTNVSKVATDAFTAKKMVPSTKIITVYNGVDTSIFSICKQSRVNIRSYFDYSSDNFVFLAVGKFKEAKNYPMLIKSFSKHFVDNPGSRLLMVGDGPLKSEMEVLVDRLHLNHAVKFTGNRDDIPELMSSCDAFVLSSAWEGFGLVVAESMSCERPVIATDCGGVSEVIRDTDYLIEPFSIVSLVERMNYLVKLQRAELWEMGKANREYIECHFSIQNTLNNWFRLYKKNSQNFRM